MNTHVYAKPLFNKKLQILQMYQSWGKKKNLKSK